MKLKYILRRKLKMEIIIKANDMIAQSFFNCDNGSECSCDNECNCNDHEPSINCGCDYNEQTNYQ